MSWHGRRVTDPKPVGWAPLDEYGTKTSKGLDPVFKGMDQAKSQLRNIEHRLQDAERPPLMMPGDDSLNVPIDRVPSYVLNPLAQSSSVLVDTSGKTHHLRSREEMSRKVSRMEDKHKDRDYGKELRQRCLLRDSNPLSSSDARQVAWADEELGGTGTSTGATLATSGYKTGTGSLATSGYKTASGLSGTSGLVGTSTFRGLQSLVESRPTRSAAKGVHGAGFTHDEDGGVLTQDGGVRGYMDLPGRWSSKTELTGAAGTGSGSGSAATGGASVWGRVRVSDPLASTYPPKSSASADACRVPSDLLLPTMSASGSSMTAPSNVNATYTLNGGGSSTSTSPTSGRFKSKKSLRDLESSSDTLAKLREKVRQQKLASSGESVVSSENDLHVTHSVNDPVISRKPAHQMEPPVIVRKVAAGPPIPRYQGFSEADTKYILPDGKMVKFSEFRKRKQRKLRKEDRHPASATDQDEKKPPKVQRVIAPPKKLAKTDKQTGDIITTRSWRVGPKIVLQELGPNKLPATTESPPVKDKVETQKHSKVTGDLLSSDARSVLRDIQDKLDSEEDEEKEKEENDDSKKPHKRKRKPLPALNDMNEDEKLAKVRHYDPDEVKRYMAKQRADRKKREQEETARAQELRKQREAQLAELFRRQREAAARVAPPLGGSGVSSQRSDTLRQDHALKPSGESDKENGGSAWGEASSSDSTLSGSSGHQYPADVLRDIEVGDDNLPAMTDIKSDAHGMPYPSTGSADGAPAGPGLGATAARFLAEAGIKPDDVVNRFSNRAANIGSSYGAPHSRAPALPGASTLPTYLHEQPPVHLPNQPFSASSTVGGPMAALRQQRIRALAENASLLEHRLSSQTKQMISLAQAKATAEQWTHPREEDSDGSYVTRYDRMAGTVPFKAYEQEIPGVSSLRRHSAKLRGEVSTTGHGDRGLKSIQSDDPLSELSDSTLHEDDLYQPLPCTKIAPGKIRLPVTPGLSALRGTAHVRPALSSRWEEPAADPYSILNVLSRRKDPLSRDPYKRVGLFDDSEPPDADNTLGYLSDQHLSDSVSLSDDSTFTGETSTDKNRSVTQRSQHSTLHHSATDHAVPQRSQSPISVSQLSEEDSSLNKYTKSYTESRSRLGASHRSASRVAGQRMATEHSASSRHTYAQHSLKEGGLQSEKKTTLEDHPAVAPLADDLEPIPNGALISSSASLSSLASTQEDDLDDTLEGAPSPEPLSEVADLPDDAAQSMEITDISETSDIGVPDRSTGNRRAFAPGGIAYRSNLVSGRLSPGGLERRMTAELNLLDSMEESVRQLTKVDRTRGVALAQQESVSLAQILKAQEQGHAQQLAAYQRDSAFLTRELAGAQRTAASAAEGASTSIEKARQETTRSMQESTINFIAAQSEAAKATAEAARQLAEVKIAASGAAGSITDKNTSKLIKETAIATATAVSTVLKDKLGKRGGDDRGTQYSSRSHPRSSTDSYATETFESDYSQSYTNIRSRSKPSQASRPESRMSYSRGAENVTPSPGNSDSIKTGSVVTASDLSQKSASSVVTESGVGAVASSHDNSKSESILEEVMSEKVNDDYSIDFDTSVTEEEMEKSLREVLPSKDHRRKVKKTSSQSDMSSIASDDHKDALNSLSTPSSRRLSFEGDSFTKFTVDMVRQYMREEEIRAQHQGALLKLRERALKEKTQAELAWLEQQKTRSRDKGADEVYPLIKKKRRGLLLKLQQEQAEIRRLKEASRAASKERQFLLMQSQEIARLRQTTQQITAKTRHGGSGRVEQWLSDLDSSSLDVDSYSNLAQVKEKIKSGPAAASDSLDIPTEDELNFNLDDSEILSLPSPSKDESVNGDKKADLKPLQKLRKMKLDDKFLTHREQQLLQRRAQVEGLLEWKQKLDREEAEIEAMEKAARNLNKSKKDAARGEKEAKGAPRKEKEGKEGGRKDKEGKEGSRKDKEGKEGSRKEKEDKEASRKDKIANEEDIKEKSPSTSRTQRTSDTIASELDSIQEESYSESFTATASQSASAIWHLRADTHMDTHTHTDAEIPEAVPGSARSQPSISSIAEDLVSSVATSTSVADECPTTARSAKRTPDSSEDATVISSTHEEYTNETFESDAGTTTPSGAPAPSPAPPGSKKGATTPPRLQLGSYDSSRSAPRSPKSPLKSPLHRTGSESESEDSISVAHSETASDQSDLETRIRALSEDLKRRKLEAERLKKEAKKQQKERLRQEEVALQKQIEAYDKYIAEARLEITDDLDLQERASTSAVQPQIKRPALVAKRPRAPLASPKDKTPSSRIDSDGVRSSSTITNGEDTPLSPITPGGHEDISTDKTISFADSIAESLMSPITSGKKTSTPDDKSMVESRTRKVEHALSKDGPSEITKGEPSLEEVKLRLDMSRTEEPADRTEPQSGHSSTEDIPTESGASPVSTSSLTLVGEKSSVTRSKSAALVTSVTSEKPSKSSTDFVDDSNHSRSDKSKSDMSITHSSSKTNGSYTEEFTEGKQTKVASGDHSESQLQKKMGIMQEKALADDSSNDIQTDDDISEQLDVATDDEADPMFELDPTSLTTPAIPEQDPLAHLHIGDCVLVGGARPGVLKFKGTVKFTDGYFGGVELDKSEGTNSGIKDGVEYFHCLHNHGIFAPPEKLELMPANWKEAELDNLTSESDISEATIHETVEDMKKIAALRKDVTKSDSENKALSSPREADESLTESVATTVDSELERVISSTAAAVESFGMEQLEAEPLDNLSSMNTIASDALTPTTPPPDMEKVVDRITDGLLNMVVKDSMDSIEKITQQVVAKRQSSKADSVSTPPQKLETVPKDKPLTAIPTADDDLGLQTQAKPDLTGGDKAVAAATQKLLDESISQMLSIYKKKQRTADDAEVSKEPTVRTWPADSAADPSLDKSDVRRSDLLTLDENGFDPFPGLSNDFNGGKEDLDQMYDELGSLTGDTDEWFDDDFGLGIEKRAPPPYPGTPQDKKDKSDSSDLHLDLRKVTQEPFYAVPHRPDEVRNLVERAVDVFWELRRYGESWDDVTSPPESYLKPDDGEHVQDIESENRRAYKQLVFKLTGEVLTDIYQDEDVEEEPCSWMPPRRTHQRFYRGHTPPTVRELIQPVVEEQVLRLSGLQSGKSDSRLAKWSSRKKRDRVDNVLLQELVEEEPDWVDYNEDETTVKMQIADSIFDSLLVETAAVFTKIAQRRSV